MEMYEVRSEMEALLKLYALHRWIGEGTSTQPESSACPYLDERSWMLLKDLLDRKWETTLRTYSQLASTAAPPNQPPPVLKRQCSHCQQRSLKRQASIKVPETGQQVFVRSVSSSGSGYSSSSWTTRASNAFSSPTTDSATSSSCSSYSVEKPIARAGHARRWGRPRARSISSSSSTDSFSSYSAEKPERRRPFSHALAIGDKIRTGLKNNLGKLFRHRQRHHHHSGGTSLLSRAKELLLQPRRKRPNKPTQAQRAKTRPKRLHWWQLSRRRTEAARRNPRKEAAGRKPKKEAAGRKAGRKPKKKGITTRKLLV